MFISEIFHTVQGEGMYTGVPSTFVRTSGCNLRCDWCDTPYTSWKPEGTHDKMEEVLAKIDEITPNTTTHVVITGGEPYLQKDLDILVKELYDRGKTVTIETNGIMYRDINGTGLVSWSPKMDNSNPLDKSLPEYKLHTNNRAKANYKNVADTVEDLQVKFVVQSEKDLQTVLDFQQKYWIPNDQIYLMPEGRTEAELKTKAKWVVEICKEKGFRYCPRAHIEIYGQKRGV